MMKFSENSVFRRIVSLMLTFAMLLSLIVVMPVSVSADEENISGSMPLELIDADYIPDVRDHSKMLPSDDGIMPVSLDEDEYVRVSIVVEGGSTLSAGFAAKGIADNASAMSYRSGLRLKQEDVVNRIRTNLGIKVDVVWNLTLAANIISANVRRGDIEAIKSVPGVVDVYEEAIFTATGLDKVGVTDTPNMANSPILTGSNVAWANGYTGAGSKVAIIDTGLDLEHIAFDGDALLYSYQQNGYDTSLLMTEADIQKVYSELNMSDRGDYTSDFYYSEKVPVAFNYMSGTANVRHTGNGLDPHGSHVAGIAAANAYIPDGNGGFTDVTTLEDEASRVKGVAPDAQIFAMEVFSGGGARESDYIAALEDAMLLGADACNLSLGSDNGFSHSDQFGKILEDITASGTVVSVSQGNSGAFSDYLGDGNLHSDDVSFNLAGSPGSYTDSFTVASVNNGGYVEQVLTLDGTVIPIYDAAAASSGSSVQPFYTLGESVDYIYIEDTGTKEQLDFLKEKGLVEGKVVCIERGDISFAEKANNAVEAGAIGVIIVNTDNELFGMLLDDYKYTAPVVSVASSTGRTLRSSRAMKYEQMDDGWFYYYIPDETRNAPIEISAHGANRGEQIMSDFSSWGVPGSLELKPEITAPGGNINSVLGANDDVGGEGIGTAAHNEYIGMSGTSMAAPHIAGMVAVVDQFVRENSLADRLGLTPRVIAQSLLMSTATPIGDPYNAGNYYPVLFQGAGVANVGNAVSADAFIMMDPNATASYADGKVKVELGDDPAKTGVYDYTFTITNIGEGTNSYTFNTNLFTQAIEGAYLSKSTTNLPATVTYEVDDVPYEVVASIEADVDKDGDTDEYDAVAILNYLVGNNDGTNLDLVAADVDEDTEVTSYDAHLILAGLGTRVTLEKDESVKVDVHIVLNDKASLDSYYVNGAWIEGYTTVSAEASADGVLDVDYSIPIVGFYGNWTDPSMFEPQTAIEALYGTDDTPNYGGAQVSVGGMPIPSNGLLTYVDSTDGGEYIVNGNPFVSEDEYPADRLAMRSVDTLSSFYYSLIRSASDVITSIRDASGKVIWDIANADVRGMFVNSSGSLSNYSYTQKLNVTPGAAGLSDGDEFTVSITAIPEYYLMNAVHDESAVIGLVESGVLGKGATLSYTLTVDDTAPVIGSASVGIEPDNKGDLTFKVTDNENLAFVAVMRRSEAEIYAYDVPATSECEFTATAEELEGAGEFVLLFAGDYAGNITAKVVAYPYGENPSVAGQLIGVNMPDSSDANFRNFAWRTLVPEEVAYDMTDFSNGHYTGIDYYAPANGDPEALIPVSAATYYDGFVFFVGQYEDGTTTALYAASVDEPDYIYLVSDLPAYGIDAVTALSYNEEYGIVALSSNSIYSLVVTIDPLSGEAELLGAVAAPEIQLPFVSLAIAPDGTCYGDVPTTSSGLRGALYTFDLFTVEYYGMFGYVASAEPVDVIEDEPHSNLVSMVYDDVNDKIYAVETYAGYMTTSYMFTFDVATGVLEHSNTTDTGSYYYMASNMPSMYGLCLVPEDTDSVTLQPTTTATDISVSTNELEILVGENYAISAQANPWTLELSDEFGYPISTRAVTWTVQDPSVVMINGNVITGLKAGTTTIEGKSVATPEVTTGPITVTVTTAPSYELNAFVYGTDVAGWAIVNSSNPKGYIELTDSDYPVYAGTNSGVLADGSQKIYVQDGNYISEIDAATLEPTGRAGAIMYTPLLFSDMAELPEYAGEAALAGTGYPTPEYIAIGGSGDMLIMGYVDDPGESAALDGYITDFGSPMVGIANRGVYTINLGGVTAPGLVYMIICEDGTIHQICVILDGVYAGQIGTLSTVYDTGIKNPGAGDFYGTNAEYLTALGSLFCDPETNMILYSVYNTAINPDTALLYYIKLDEETGEAHVAADPEGFGPDIWPAVALINRNAITYDASKASIELNADVASLQKAHSLVLEPNSLLTMPVRPARAGSFFSAPIPEVPAVTEPAVTEPAVTEPEVTEPEVTEPEVTEPAVTEPAVTEPEPEVTEPAPLDPAQAPVVGSLNSITVEGNSPALESQYVDPDNCTVMVQVKVTDYTNGLLTVTYDPTLLKLTKSVACATFSAIDVDEEAGVITFAYACADPESGMVLDLLFTYDDADRYEDFPNIVVDALEENEPGNDPDPIEIPVDPNTANGPEHVHNYVMVFNDEVHWLQCLGCGAMTGPRELHNFVNGVCTGCLCLQPGYAVPNTPAVGDDTTVEIESPVEAKLNESVVED